jgi:hypothetical protein
MLRGLPGILAAHEILKERGGSGILVGGLAEAVWNKSRTKVELASHKDVDVLVTSSLQTPLEDFEGGVDWWVPEDIHFDKISSASGDILNITKRFWVNGAGCALCYRIKPVDDLPPGLHILSPTQTVSVRIAEAGAMIEGASVEFADDSDDLMFDRIRRGLGVCTALPVYLNGVLGDESSPWRSQRYFREPQLRSVPLEEQRALNNIGGYRTGR